ncbi:hypothetical protein VCHENC02_2991B, partial [Vibrio harveyi]
VFIFIQEGGHFTVIAILRIKLFE